MSGWPEYLISVFFNICSPGGGIMDRKELQGVKDKAEELYSMGKFQASFDAYKSINKFAKVDPKIFLRLGDILRKLNNKSLAVVEYENAARAYAERGFIVKAIAICKMILNLDPTKAGIEERLAAHYSQQNSEEPTSPVKDEFPYKYVDTKRVSLEDELKLVEEPKPESASEEMIEFEFVEVEDSELLDHGEGLIDEVALHSTPLFSDLSQDELQHVIEKIKYHRYNVGDYVFKKGSEGDSIYVITSGAAEAIGYTKYAEETKCATLMDGDFFGEHRYFSGMARNAELRAITELELLEIGRKNIAELARKHPHINKVLRDFYTERALDHVLALSKVFRHLSGAERRELLDEVTIKRFKKGVDIVKSR